MESEKEDCHIVLSQEQMRRVEVPGDGSCLFWAVALPYLIQVNNNPDLFNERLERLFGEKELVHSHHVRHLIYEFRTSHYNNIYGDEILRQLVTQVFCHKLVDRMSQCEEQFYQSISIDDFKDTKNESFVTDGTFRDNFVMRFSFLFEGSRVDLDKLKPEILDKKTTAEISCELDKIVKLGCGDLLQRFMFRMYLEAMRSCSSWGGNHEIETMERMLECDIFINFENRLVSARENSIICLFNNHQIHDQFYLVKAQFLVQFIDRNSEEKSLKYLKIGVDEINYQNSNGSTLLHFAAKNNHVRSLHLLINQGADSNIKNHLGQTPLDIATSLNAHVFITALNYYKQIDLPDLDSKQTDLMSKQTDKAHLESNLDKSQNDKNITETLSEHEINRNGMARTAVHTEAELRDDVILGLVLAILWQYNHVSPSTLYASIRGERKQTALHLAAKNNRVKAVDILLENKAEVNVRDENSEGFPDLTPLHYAAEKGHLEIVKLLIEKGKAEIDAPDRTKETPLQRAVRFGQLSVVKYLVGLGADVNSRDQNSISVLSYAAKAGCLQIAHFLVEKSAEINAMDKNSITPLHHAASSNNWDIVKYLVERGADPNVESKNNETALTKVVMAGQWSLAKLLIENEALTKGLTEEQIGEILRKNAIILEGEGAIFNLIGLGNFELLKNHINKLGENNPFLLNELLPKIYNEIQLLNISLTQLISLFIESQIINCRLFSDRKTNETSVNDNENDVELIKQRISLIIVMFHDIYLKLSMNEINDVFLFVGRFIARNMQILKNQLRVSFDKLPWIEMQFCLVNFISEFFEESKNVHFISTLALNKARLVKHLLLFKTELERLNVDVTLDNKYPFRNRKEMVDSVLESNSNFRDLYEDYELLRDIYSLNRIESYLNPACLVDLIVGDVLVGEQVILRALQVTGEFLKNTIESPNMSDKVHHLLITLAPKNVIKIVTSLRDSLSHVEHLHKGNTTEPNSLVDIQKDLMKLKDQITFILFLMKTLDLELFFRRLSECENINQAAELVIGVQYNALKEVDLSDKHNGVFDKVVELMEKYKSEIKNPTSVQQFILKKLENIVAKYKIRLVDAKQIQIEAVKCVDYLIALISEGEEIEAIRKIARSERIKLQFSSNKNYANCFEVLLENCNIIYKSFDDRSRNISVLYYEIFQLIEFEAKRVKSMDKFRTEMAKDMNFDDEIEKWAKFEQIVNNILKKVLEETSDIEIRKQLLNKIEIKREVFRSKITLIDYYSKIMQIYSNIINFYDNFIDIYDALRNYCRPLIDFFNTNITATTLTNDKLIKLIEENNFAKLYSDFQFKDLITENAFKILIEKIKLGEIKIEEIVGGFQFDKLIEDKKLINKNLFKNLIEDYQKNSLNKSKKIKDEEKVERLIDKNKIKLLIDEIRQDLKVDENIFSALIDNVQLTLKKGETHKALFSDFSFSKCKTILNSLRKIDAKLDSYGKLAKDVTKESEIAELSEPFGEFIRSLNVSFSKVAIDKAFEKIKVEQIIQLKSYFFEKLVILTKIFHSEKSDLELLVLLKTDNIRIAVEMLVLNLTETLDQLSLFEKNKFHLDECSPVLVGKNLRNYLAHGDPLINILPTNYLISLIHHFRLFQREFHHNDEFYSGQYFIGKVTKENHSQVQQCYQHCLEILLTERNLFSVNKDTEIVEFKTLINKSLYLKVKNSLGDTLLHFAARANNLCVFKYLFEQGLSVYLENKYGHNAIYKAISTGSERIIEFLLNKSFDPSLVVENGQTLLHAAVQFGHLHVVELLLRYGADIEATNNQGSKPIVEAVVKGHNHIVVELINAGSDVESEDESGKTLTHLATLNVEVLKTLLERNVNVNALDRDGNTPLHLACSRGKKQTVELLLNNGANVRNKNKDGATALHYAANEGHTKILELLLRNENVNIDTRTSKKLTALHLACFHGHFDVVKDLLKHGANFNLRNDKDMTALHVVAMMGHARLIDILLEYPVDIDSLSEGMTALHMAAESGVTEVVKKLVEGGANIFLKGRYGLSVLHLAALNKDLEMMEFILEKEIFLVKSELLNAMDANGRTALHSAIETNEIKTVNFLLEKHADLEAKDFKKITPLFLSAVKGHTNIFNVLFSKGADINFKDADGWSVVHAAAYSNNKEIVNALIKRKMSVDLQSVGGTTPLHLASQNGHLDMVKLLLKIGAQIDLTNVNGYSALHFASLNGHVEIVRYLLKNNAKNHFVDSDAGTPLHLAVQHAHFRVLEVLLDNNNRYVDARSRNKFTALHLAAENGSVLCVNLLLNNGADVNATCKDDLTALHLAAMKGHEEVVRILVVKVTNIEAKLTNGCTALHLAAQGNYLSVVETLITNGANFNCVDVNGKSALHSCSALGCTNTALRLLKHGVTVGLLDNAGTSALHFAAGKGHIGIVRGLLENGAEINRQNKYGWTALYMATIEGHDDVVQLLLANKAAMNVLAKNGNAMLHLAAKNGHFKVVETVLKHDETDVDIKNVVGETPLHISAAKGHTQIVQLLLNKSANVYALTEERSTALHFASHSGHFETAQLLLNSGATVDLPCKHKLTSLHVAVLNGHLEVAKVLIKHGADVFAFDDHNSVLHKTIVNEKMLEYILKEIEMQVNGDADRLKRAINALDKDGDTPLMWAAEKGHLNAAKLLLKCDAIDINMQNFDGMTALHWSVQNGHRDFVELLIANKVNARIKNNKGQTAFDVASQLQGVNAKYAVIAAFLGSRSTTFM